MLLYIIVNILKLLNKLLLDENDAESIKKCKQILKSNNLEANLAFIMSNYGFISTSITRLETKGMSLTESIKIIKTTKESIHSAKVGGCAQAKAIYEKFQKVMEKNVGFVQLQKISDIISGQNESMDGLPEADWPGGTVGNVPLGRMLYVAVGPRQ